jgi:hypothetical protein
MANETRVPWGSLPTSSPCSWREARGRLSLGPT